MSLRPPSTPPHTSSCGDKLCNVCGDVLCGCTEGKCFDLVTGVTATNTVREVNDANSVGTPIMGHKTTSPDVVSLGVPRIVLDGPSNKC